jgi:hypothetical protein
MTPRTRSALAAFLFALAPGLAPADEPKPKEPTEPPPQKEPIPPPKDLTAPAAVAACGKPICLPKYTLMEVQSATTLPRFQLRDETVGAFHGTVVDYLEERRTVTELVLKPHTVDQQVTCYEPQPCTTIDPCTGCPKTEYKPAPVTKTVQITVYDAVPTPREVVVRVPYLKPGGDYVVKRIAADPITIPAIERRLQLLTTPNEVTAPVAPLPTPCPALVCPVPPACPPK